MRHTNLLIPVYSTLYINGFSSNINSSILYYWVIFNLVPIAVDLSRWSRFPKWEVVFMTHILVDEHRMSTGKNVALIFLKIIVGMNSDKSTSGIETKFSNTIWKCRRQFSYNETKVIEIYPLNLKKEGSRNRNTQ